MPGKLADMAILSDDIFLVAPAKIRDVRVLKMFVGERYSGTRTMLSVANRRIVRAIRTHNLLRPSSAATL